MEHSLVFLYTVFSISIVIYIAAGITTAIFVIPLQIKELHVKNGLFKLRRQLLIRGVFSFIVILISLVILNIRFFVTDVNFLRYAITVLILVHAIGTLIKSVIDYKIYHQQYTVENKRFHEEVEKLERAGEK